MKILGLYTENFKRLKVVEILPDGTLVQVTGENRAGKTSVFDAIWVALEGLKSCQKMPIRDGEDQALVQVKLGEKEVKFIVTRTFQKTTEGFDSKLKVESPDGAGFASPQAMLDKFLGALSFDPLAFTRMSVKEQFEYLKKFVSGFDFDKADKENKRDFDERTVVNRQLTSVKNVEASIKDAPLEEPEKPDTKSLTDRLANAATKNAAIEKERAAREKSMKELVIEPKEGATKTFIEAKEALERARKAYEAADANQALIIQAAVVEERKLAALPTLEALEDVTVIKTELDAATPKFAKWQNWAKRADARKAVSEYEEKAKALTAAIEKRNAEKVKAITDSKLPVEGLTLGEEVVLLNGVPFDQASAAEKILASSKMAMAANPDLKVIFIKDGSLLDSKSMELLAKLADESGYQIWIERVDGSGSVGFVIEDGRLKEAIK